MNYSIYSKLIHDAAQSGCKIAFLPEAFDFIGRNKKETFELAETINGDLISSEIDQVLTNLNSCGFHVPAIVADNHSANVNSFKQLLKSFSIIETRLFAKKKTEQKNNQYWPLAYFRKFLNIL